MSSSHLKAIPTGVWSWMLRHPALSALAGYACAGLVVFHPLLRRLSTHILSDDVFINPGQSDAFNFLWTYWWIQHAVRVGELILHCDWVLPPNGANLVLHTHLLLPTLVTLPLGRLVGPVAAYNLTIVGMVTLGAWAYFLFLRKSQEVSFLTALTVGLLFGFSPYFVFKAHAHPNLVGAFLWASALGLLVVTYQSGRFTWARAALFGLLAWATFWSSFVEFFMLAVSSLLVIGVYESSYAWGRLRLPRAGAGRAALARRAVFFVPTFLGAASLLVLRAAGDLSAADVPLDYPLEPADLLRFPRLSVFSSLGTPAAYEYWGTFVPFSVVALIAVGLIRCAMRRQLRLLPIAVLAGVTLLLAFDPARWASGLIRTVPAAEGFRVYARFFPFFLFFVLVFASIGLESLINGWKFRGRLVVAAILLSAAAAEMYPWQMQPSAVKNLPTSEALRERLDRTRFLWVIPRGRYLNVHDTYQVALEMPCVNLSYLARQSGAVLRARNASFPITYGREPVGSLAALESELTALNVGYVLFEDKRDAGSLPIRGRPMAVWEKEILLELE